MVTVGEHYDGGGDKTVAKLIVLRKYLWAYLNIVGSWGEPWYIDTHAATGRTNPFGGCLNMKGSSLVALEHDFDRYWFFENCSDDFDKLCSTIEEEEDISLTETGEFSAMPYRQDSSRRISVVNGDSNKGVQMLVERYSDHIPWFIFMDPERVRDLKKEPILQLIERGTTDLLINFQTTGYVRSGAGDADHAWETVEECIGEDFPIGGDPDDFVDHFKENVIGSTGYTAKSKRMISESDRSWRYDLVFAAGPEVATRIMGDVMGKSLRDEITEEIVDARSRTNSDQRGFEEYSLSIEDHNDDQQTLEDFW